MELKPGFHIKLLTAIKAGKIIIPRGDVVLVIDVSNKGAITVQDILDNKVILPKNAKYKLVSTRKMKAKITSAVIPMGSIYKAEKANLEKVKPSIARTRSIQLAQVIASSALSSDDPITLSKLSIAGSMLAMSLAQGIDQNQYSRLYQFARKLASN